MNETNDITNSLIYINISLNVIIFTLNAIHLYQTYKLNKLNNTVKDKIKNTIENVNNCLSNAKIVELDTINKNTVNDTVVKKTLQLDKIEISLQGDENFNDDEKI